MRHRGALVQQLALQGEHFESAMGYPYQWMVYKGKSHL